MNGTDPAFKRGAVLLKMPAEHQQQARARLALWRIMRTVKPAPDGPRRHPGGWFAPRRKDDPA